MHIHVLHPQFMHICERNCTKVIQLHKLLFSVTFPGNRASANRVNSSRITLDCFWAHLCLCMLGSYASASVCPSVQVTREKNPLQSPPKEIIHPSIGLVLWTGRAHASLPMSSCILSPPVQHARWAHRHRILSVVCRLSLDQNSLNTNSHLYKYCS